MKTDDAKLQKHRWLLTAIFMAIGFGLVYLLYSVSARDLNTRNSMIEHRVEQELERKKDKKKDDPFKRDRAEKERKEKWDALIKQQEEQKASLDEAAKKLREQQ